MIPCCVAHGVGVIPYFPLAGGFLTGKYRRGEPPPPGSRGASSAYVRKYMTPASFDRIERLATWAGERGRQLTELAQAWLLARPQVCTVISGATRVEHVQASARAGDWHLDPAEVAAVDALLA